MKVNGKDVPLTACISLEQWLLERRFNPDVIAVELNGEIIPRVAYGNTELSDGDTLEVVRFVGGG